MIPDLDKIPPELKAFPQWVCYRQNKIPVNPKTGDNAKADDPSTWDEFDQAVRHWEAHRGNGITGIGYEFSGDDPFAGVDLDKCRNPETGEIEPWALEIVTHLNSYTEVSPSGTGLHIWIKGQLPPDGRHKGKVEMYDSGRYFTVTGHHIEGTSTTIENRQAELEALHAEIFGKTSEEPKRRSGRYTKSGGNSKNGLSDDALLDEIFKSKAGNKFRDLWQGDIDYLKFHYAYPSPSEADIALCSILAFWTEKDAQRIDRLFRKSGLMRNKWDEYRGAQKYGEKTIAKAIANTKEVWKGARKRKNANQKKDASSNNTSPQNKGHNPLDGFNKKHAVIMVGGKCQIMNEIIDPVFNRPDITFSSINDFKNRYSNMVLEYTDNEGNSREVPLTALWLKTKKRRQYEGIVFAPGKCIPNYYNLYKGFAVEAVKGDWFLFRKFMFEIIAGGSEEIFKYLLRWMARLVQDPGGDRIGVSIVMRGKMGVGKGVFTTQFGEIFGSHFLHISNPTHLVGKFNNHFKSAILVFVDEGNWAGDKAAEGVLKAMITEKHLMIEPKGKDSFPIENHIHLIFASNNAWVVPAGLEERRFLVLDVSDKHMQDHDYFGAIIELMNNGGREALLYDLLEMEVKDEDLRKIPRTSALLDQIVHTMPAVHKFWLERLRAGTLLKRDYQWKEFVVTEDLHGQYLEFAQAVGDKNGLIDRQFGKELRRLCPNIKRVRRTIDGQERWVLLTPPLDICRTHFENMVHMKINWGSEEFSHGQS